MKIKTIEIKGFLSIGTAAVNLDRKGITLVEGVNHDSPADSNGAGKSSIFEALHWCLFGSTRRGLTGDDIINRHVKGGTMVNTRFSSRGVDYSVQRARKDKERGTGLWLWVSTGEELTKGTMKDTQALIEEIIGMNMLTFQKTVYFGQGDIKPIAELTDAELKAVFEQGLGLSQIPVDAQKVSGYRKGLEAAMTSKMRDHKSATMMLEVNRTSHTEKAEALAGFNEKRSKRLDELRLDFKVSAALAEKSEEEARRSEEGATKASTDMAKIEGQLASMGEMRAKFDDKSMEVMGRLARSSTLLPRLSAEVKELVEAEKRISGREGESCESCGLIMDAKAVSTSVKVLQAKRMGIAETIAAEEARHKADAEERKGMDKVFMPFMDKMNKLEHLLKETADHRHALAKAKALADNAALLRRTHADRVFTEIESVKADDGKELADAVLKAAAAVDQYEEAVAKLEEEVIKATIDHDTAKMLEAALGNAGLKSLVFDRVTPSLNRYANDALAVLDPGMNVEISTVTVLKTGERRERFSVSVETDTGAKVFAGHSGGEKQKVNLAVSLAFNTLMRKSSVNAPNLLVLDEPFESLDAGSSDQVMELLTGLDVDNVWLISHNQSVKDLIPSRILVEKKGGISTVG